MWRRKTAIVGLGGIGVLIFVALAAPWIAPYQPAAQDLSNILAPPVWAGGDWTYPLGTDALGRDVLSRMIYGARSSVLISAFAMLIGATLGLLTGLIAGFFGRFVDTLIMRLGDIQLALPFILIAIVILGMMTERAPIHLIVVLGIPAWIVYARVVRARTLAEREQDYVRAAETIGARPLRRMFRYVLPQVRSVMPAIALIDLSHLVVMESTLSFLGFGLTSPHVSWGQILADGRQNMVVAPWLPVLPGVAIMLTVLCINLAVEGMRSKVEPRRRWWSTGWRRLGAKRAAPNGPAGPEASTVPAAPAGPSATTSASVADEARAAPTPDDVLLDVRGLSVEFPAAEGRAVQAVRGVSFMVGRGKILGIVGESGSGKSVTSYALLRLLSAPGRVNAGSAVFDGVDLLRVPERAMRRIRGRRIGMIFQNPVGSLNPVLTVGYQMIEAIRTNRDVERDTAVRLAEKVFRDVGFADPAHIMKQYPFRLSGGQNQRVMIAMTMAIEPELLLADEPTTALDVTTQAQVLDQLRRVRDEHGTSIMIISHDIGLIGEIADEVVVMYAGEVCESGPTERVLREPRHPYTQALLESVPRPEAGIDTELRSIPGELPDPTRDPVGCPFAPRCAAAMDVCRTHDPQPSVLGVGWSAACHLYSDERSEVTRR
ncbi:dipeptide/oligopeptide/nickel ABC transporter permease/ATP-binding protein [Phytoactinopolyspora halotolerans]|uniref:Dipeptide/oligopeptide/nickel ABC transporter permease/ATP-binding protein n=1 Tax=Phytoactinopolyspora halotolerans TaxID=1981512 RepID=A0A6L9SDN7_9ACTN|nr:dipeptide/oligopeptide/nickel ABC transporter permease/ATP-binding protein [Phytoactinopolyspora halotolerans]NEE03263.1 dipeptide/oligopeptide/nickel ABC transporter permease/ATP-binding protein [Phytoactinopolyspora halotolerans]